MNIGNQNHVELVWNTKMIKNVLPVILDYSKIIIHHIDQCLVLVQISICCYNLVLIAHVKSFLKVHC